MQQIVSPRSLSLLNFAKLGHCFIVSGLPDLAWALTVLPFRGESVRWQQALGPAGLRAAESFAAAAVAAGFVL